MAQWFADKPHAKWVGHGVDPELGLRDLEGPGTMVDLGTKEASILPRGV